MKLFEFNGLALRVIGSEEATLVPIVDVCRILEIEDTGQAGERLDEDEIVRAPVMDALGREQMTNCVTEAGLYTLILRSDKPQAKVFRRWLTHEVLPEIRRTGSYGIEGRLWQAFNEARTGAAQVAALELIGRVAGLLPGKAGPPPPRVMAATPQAEPVDVGAFWDTVLEWFQCDGVQHTREGLHRVFKFVSIYAAPADAPAQTDWAGVLLHIEPRALLELLNTRLRAQGETPLNRHAVAAALAAQPYWATRPGSRQRFGRGAGISPAWAIALDLHPLGYQPESDEAWAEWKAKATGEPDPRQGPLFEIVRALKREAL